MSLIYCFRKGLWWWSICLHQTDFATKGISLMPLFFCFCIRILSRSIQFLNPHLQWILPKMFSMCHKDDHHKKIMMISALSIGQNKIHVFQCRKREREVVHWERNGMKVVKIQLSGNRCQCQSKTFPSIGPHTSVRCGKLI